MEIRFFSNHSRILKFNQQLSQKTKSQIYYDKEHKLKTLLYTKNVCKNIFQLPETNLK